MLRKTILTLALFVLALPVVAPAHAAPPDPRAVAQWRAALAQPHAEGELLVALRPASDGPSAQAQVAALSGAQHLGDIPALGLARYRVSDDLATTLAALNDNPAIVFAEPNYLIQPDLQPNDPRYLDYAANDAVTNGGYLNRMNMAAAWDIEVGDPAIVVAVIDSGIDLDHPDLADGLWHNPGEIADNGVDDDDNGFIDDYHGWNFADETPNTDDWLGHGTHVSGIIGARFNNGIGIAGVAPKVRLMPVGVFAPPGFGTFADEVEAIIYAVDEGANVINLSLGSTAYSRGEQMAVEYAVDHGVVVVASAGNNGRTLYNWPAAHEAAIAVAATTASDARASFSNMGDFVDVAAPGNRILSTAMGGGYTYMSGTSMAAPHTSGVAALILSRNPTLTPAEVRAILQTTAADLGAPGPDTSFGYGRVDALAALLATPPSTDPPPERGASTTIWPGYCTELAPEGNFESDLGAEWQLSGAATVTDTVAAHGARSLYLAGAPAQWAEAQRAFSIPPDMLSATLAFAVRLENQDRDLGTDPTDPGRDHLRVWFRTADGQPVLELASLGNAAYDLASSLSWDRVLHVLSADELALLRQTGDVQLWFRGENGPDALPTRFFVDDVRLCITQPTALHLPLIVAP